MPPVRGICPKCKQHKKLTRHHVYPKRWKKAWGKKKWRKLKDRQELLCRACHDELERVLFLVERAASNGKGNGRRVKLEDYRYPNLYHAYLHS